MSLSDRRLFLISLLALGACGFTPAYGPGGMANGLRGSVEVDAPEDREAYELVKRLEERLGRPDAPLYRLSYRIDARTEGVGVTPGQEITRTQVFGTVAFTLADVATGEAVYEGSVESFTSYSTLGSTVSAAAVERDAYRRLMVALADLMVARLVVTAPDRQG